ncbi:hypothetical protein ARMGADRAFT_1035052 [Armillaria gallica]|uniref:Uncharacterized protein n=1 Tax=Armillaria gallica TaxID=47427 RepID=A0A2H3CVU8_ARMGA|nr:hypothetical protein ARMGADRAFT_1035052 [Armillaria gallica]
MISAGCSRKTTGAIWLGARFQRGKFIPGTGIKGTNFLMAAYTLNDVPIKFRSKGGGLDIDYVWVHSEFISFQSGSKRLFRVALVHLRESSESMALMTAVMIATYAAEILFVTGETRLYFTVDGSGHMHRERLIGIACDNPLRRIIQELLLRYAKSVFSLGLLYKVVFLEHRTPSVQPIIASEGPGEMPNALFDGLYMTHKTGE